METLPMIKQLHESAVAELKNEQQVVVSLLNEEPPLEWIKKNPYANDSLYLPIDKVEYLLNSIFAGRYKTEIKEQGIAFNAVWVTVRLHYKDIVTGDWMFHDGIGAKEIQVKSGSSPADLQNINKSAVAMAFPIAEVEAIKDAAHKLGRIFGSDLNRKDAAVYDKAENIMKFERGHANWTKAVEAVATGFSIDKIDKKYKNFTEIGRKQMTEDVIKYKTDNGII